MREITVRYIIDEKEEERLEKLLLTYQPYQDEDGAFPFKEWTIDDVFSYIMNLGARRDINTNLSITEWRQGLSEYDEMNRRIGE